MEQIEILGAARQLIGLHGQGAKAQSKARADRLFAIGDIAGFHKWNRVTDAIKDIERKNPPPPPSGK